MEGTDGGDAAGIYGGAKERRSQVGGDVQEKVLSQGCS